MQSACAACGACDEGALCGRDRSFDQGTLQLQTKEPRRKVDENQIQVGRCKNDAMAAIRG